MSITYILLSVSIVCNVWFVLLLLADRIADTKAARLLRGIADVWKSLHETSEERPTKSPSPVSDNEIIGKSKFRMQSPRPTAATPVPKDSTSEKGDAISENDTTFDVGNQEKGNQSAQVAFKASSSSFGIARTKFGSPLSPSSVPAEKLDETFSSLTPDELGYSEEELEEEYKPHASGCSFDEIADAVQTIKKDEPTQQELTKAGEVMTELDGTELFEKITSIMTDEVLAERLASAITAYVDSIGNAVKQARKPFVIPDKLEDFNIRDYV